MTQPVKATIACYVVTYNREDFIGTCIASLKAARSDTLDTRITIFNNASPDGTAEVLAGIDDIEVVTNEENIPLTLVLNRALELGRNSGADYLLLLNDDIEFKPGAVAELVAVCNAAPHAIASPLQINYRKPDQIDDTMLQRLSQTTALMNDAILHDGPKRYYEQRALIGSALLARRETFAAIGDFDPLFPFYGSDDDYCNRALEMGIPMYVAMRAHMLHMHGRIENTPQSSKGAWLRRWSSMYRARALFIMKDRKRGPVMGYLRGMAHIVSDMITFPFKGFPRGSVVAFKTMTALLGVLGPLRTRREAEDALTAAFQATAPRTAPPELDAAQ